MSEEYQDLALTNHELQLGDRTLSYTARAGFLPLIEESSPEKKDSKPGDAGPDKDDKPQGPATKHTANIFFVAYSVDGAEPSERPLTFAFNGGPGSSSVWLHLGALGPKMVEMDDDGSLPRPPGRLVPNEHSWLEFTDLVFIDPVTTGYSRALAGEKPETFHEVEKDVKTVAEFVRLFLTRHGRWDSPKFLAGESYGTIRAAALARELQSRHGVYLNGLVMISAALQMQSVFYSPGNDLPFITFLPSFAATAWYHGRLSEEWQKRPVEDVISEAREFAFGPYATALLRGAGLGEAAREEVVARYAELTSLDPALIERSELRVSQGRYSMELMRDAGRFPGRLDGRVLGYVADRTAPLPDHDPSYVAIQSPYTAALNAYVRSELQFECDLPYEILTDRVHPWNYSKFSNRHLDVVPLLCDAMTANHFLRTFFAGGYYDLAAPLGATEYSINHLGLPEELRRNVHSTSYASGHMIYTHGPSRAQLAEDAKAFYRGE